MIKAILFDLDGTLLPLNEEQFIKKYFGLIAKKGISLGFEQESIINTIWAGTKAMLTNDGSKTNHQAFWDTFTKVYGEDSIKFNPIFDEFYKNEFKETVECCDTNVNVRKIIEFIKENNLKIILATNPLFPKVGVLTRMSFVGLKESDFDYITSYENSYYAKPNIHYYENILNQFNLKTDEVIMFGNSFLDDYAPCKKLNIPIHMVGDYIIGENTDNVKINSIDEIIHVIKKSL